MDRTEPQTSLSRAEMSSLNEKYKDFVERLKKRWMRDNNHPPRAWRLYEIDAEERARADGVIRRWGDYITPIAEQWWRKRGFVIHWPEKPTEPCQIFKLEAEAA